MALWTLPARRSALLRGSLRLFLPISGAITLVLLPMVAVYDQGRREALQSRLTATAEAGSLRVQSALQEITGDAGVTATHLQHIPRLGDQQRLRQVLNAQLVGYERYRQLAVVDRRGRVLEEVSNGGPPLLANALSLGVRAGLRLPPRQQWMSPVVFPPGGPPCLIVARPLDSPDGQRLGVLLAVASLDPLVRDLDRSANNTPALERGYLVSADGRILNRPAVDAPGLSFAARFPSVWAQMQRRPAGVVATDTGGLFVFKRSPHQVRLAVVIQLPPNSLLRNSVFGQPAGQALVALLYLLAAGASLGIARYQHHLEQGREQERQLQERLQAVVQSAGVGMCLCDSHTGRFLTVNDALCGFFGRSEAELLACTWQELTHPEDLAGDQRLAEQLQRGELDRYRLRKRFLRPDGGSVWGDLVVACTRNADGTVRDLIGQVSDVSELVAKTAYLEAASSAGVVGVWDWDVPRDVLTWDPVMVRLYGWHAEDFQGTREAWEKAVHPDDKPFVVQELQAALRGWREYQPRFRVVWPDGSIHHLQARSRTSYGPDGAPLRMIGVNYDITEQVEREQEVEQQRQLLATTLDALVDPLLLLTLADRRQPRGASPPELCIAEVNPAAAAFFARSQLQLLGQPLTQLLPVSRNGDLHAALLAVAQGGPNLVAESQPVWLREAAEPALDSEGGEPLLLDLRAVAVRDGLVLSFRDVSEQRRAASRLAASEERYRLLAENASDVVFRANLQGVTEWITDSVMPLVGWAPADLINRPFAPFVHPGDLELLQEVDAAFSRGERRQFRLRVLCRSGDYRWVGVNARALTAADGAVVGVVGSWRDAQTEVEAETELDRRARIDPLTGLYNRQEILEQLERLTQRLGHPGQRHGDDGALAVLFCDIDRFKEINDRHGHGGGDAVLQALAQRLRASTRLGDLVGRLGGDELLVVLLAMPSLEVATAIAAKVHAAAREPLQLSSGEVVPTLSIGVTLIQPGEAIDAVVARADQAMYEAKQSGRDRVVAFS